MLRDLKPQRAQMKKRVRDNMCHRKDGLLFGYTHTQIRSVVSRHSDWLLSPLSRSLFRHGKGCPLQAGKNHEKEKQGDGDGRKLMRVTNTLHMFTLICSLRHHCVNCCWDNLFSTRERKTDSLILRTTTELLPLTPVSQHFSINLAPSLRSSLLELALLNILSFSPTKNTLFHTSAQISVTLHTRTASEPVKPSWRTSEEDDTFSLSLW